MKTRTTTFDIHITAAADILNTAIDTDMEHPIPKGYVSYFCEIVFISMWRSVSNAIVSMELYGNVEMFIFNMGGYIDSMYHIDNVRWCGFSDKQAEELKKCYLQFVQAVKEGALDIIEMYLRCMIPYDIEFARRLKKSTKPRGTCRNMEHIAWLCQGTKPTAEEVYDQFLRQARKLMYFKE